MTTTAPPTHPVRPSATPAPGPAVVRLAFRQVVRGGATVLVVAAGMSALVVATYDSVIASSPGGASSLTALATNPAVRTLFGEAVALDDPGGFAVWRTSTILAVLVGVWAALAATRILRGEEDAGRWDLLLGGRARMSAVVASHLAVLATATLAIGGAVTLALLVTGTAATGAVVHGASIALVGAVAAGLGGLASQLVADRGTAAGASVAVLVGGLLARMVGDGVAELGWLRWVSPFGLAALARPYDADRWLPLAVLAGTAVVLLAAAPAVARHRDLRGAPIAGTRSRPPRTRLLGSVPAFAVRTLLRPLAAWTLGIVAFYLLIGLISESMTDFLAENPLFAQLATQAGFAELGSAGGYAATMFTLLAVPLGGFTASRLAALARAEAARRLDLLLSAPVTRLHLLGAEAGATAAGAVLLTAVAGTATWAGAATAGAALTLGGALAGALTTLPVTALGAGAALIALGWAPRLVVPIGMLPAAGGFVLTVLADSVDAPAWVASLSPFAHLAAVPVAAPDVAGAIGMTAIAAALAAAGVIGYRRRDLRAA